MNRGGFSWFRLLGISQAKIQTLPQITSSLNQIRAPEKIWGDVWVFGFGDEDDAYNRNYRVDKMSAWPASDKEN